MNKKKNRANCLEKFEIFPYSFIRYASGNHIDFEQLRCDKVKSFAEEISTLGLEIKNLRDNICNYLHALVKEALTSSEKQFFINMKRDIYNSRNITSQDRAKLVERLNKKNKDLFEYYIVLKEKKEDLLIEWQDRYVNTITRHRGIIQELSKNELFQKGVRLSSKVFYNQLDTFSKKTILSFGKKEARLEYSLLRYLTRMYFKTSPFSTFTNLGLANLIEIGDTYTLAQGKIHSKIRLNNGIFDYLKTLLVLHPEINEHLYLQLNPTIQVKEEKISFLINFHNLESFQSIANTGVIKLLLEIARQKEKDSLRMYEFIEKLQESIDGDAQEIKEYLLKLIEIGLLEFDFQTSGTDPDWSLKLLSFLKQINISSQLLKETILVLEKQRACCEIYATSNTKERNVILEEMFRDFSMLFDHFLEKMNIFKKDYKEYKENYKSLFTKENFKKHPYILPSLTTEKLIYEDSFIEEKGEVSKTLLTAIIKDINTFIDVLQPLDSFQEERDRIRSFYIDYYGKRAEINLLDFYNLYYLHIKKPQQDFKKDNKDIYIDQHQENYNKTYRKWIEDFKTILKPIIDKNQEEISIDSSMLKAMQEKWKNNRKIPLFSRGMFMQVFRTENNFQVVVNSISQGMGRASGRFLHLFNSNITEAFKKNNLQNSKESLFMELSDGSYFNANSHPPLLDQEIKIPDGHNSLPIESQIAVKDILIYFNEDIQEVCLKHSLTGKRILPFDLCLQSLDHRSKLYQLLFYFSPEQAVSFRPIQKAVQELLFEVEETSVKREIYYFPRLVYNKQIILKRKRWSVLTKSIPQKGEQQSDADYFLSINQWKQKHNFPDQIFLYLRANTTTKGEGMADDYKPQYIRFDSPLLIILWNKLLKKAKEYIYFEEMSPNTETLKEQPVNELLTQWYFK
ncbi:lantibiotic dehydratase [Aquimarina muelleri]|uniref:Lanthionine biosynthesis protein n=1 Tax=Aquimarina muelleri TaxID=279356 RepID=A0A918JVL4_9FLAO|nr:lantibiotic dehydratase [Aquimarina muelleri]MCX2762263.1 lantibiotic dehydratase family protein [Aquimarina muelleri]GGX17975.1 lanthionine biosynthesis protein [Aquimarina muelleri]